MNPAGKSLGEKAPGAFLLPPTMHAGLLVMIAGYADAIGFLQHRAFAGQTVTIRLAEDVDVSRGDTFVPRSDKIEPAKKLDADLCWFDEEPLSPQRKYLLKQTTNTVFARIGVIKEVLDVHTLLHAVDRRDLAMNDIGRVSLTLQKPLVCDEYNTHQGTGAFVLIDEATHHTVAAGMIRAISA